MKMPHDDYESADFFTAPLERPTREEEANPRVLPVPTRGEGEASENVRYFADRLLRRGFPLHLEERGLVLSPGNWGDDLRYLAELIAPLTSETALEPLDLWRGTRHIARVDVARIQNLGQWQEQVLNYSPRRRETQFGDRNVNKDPWRSFKSMKYGAKTDVFILEAGVALLIKVLPWVSVRTIMSCHGHDQPAKIWFSGSYHSRWCQMIFRHLFRDLPIRRCFRFHHGEPSERGGNSRLLFARNPGDHGSEEQAELFDQIQVMARRLFDPELCRAIREAKSSSEDFDEMEDKLRRAVGKYFRPDRSRFARALAFERFTIPPNLPETGRREKSPGERVLADTLLQRGFPLQLEDRGLVLSPGTMPVDVPFLMRLLRRLERLSGPITERSLTCAVWNDRDYLTTVAVDDPWQLEQFRRRVLFGRSVLSA